MTGTVSAADTEGARFAAAFLRLAVLAVNCIPTAGRQSLGYRAAMVPHWIWGCSIAERQPTSNCKTDRSR